MKKERSIVLTILVSIIVFISSFISVSSIDVGVDYIYKVNHARIYAKIDETTIT